MFLDLLVLDKCALLGEEWRVEFKSPFIVSHSVFGDVGYWPGAVELHPTLPHSLPLPLIESVEPHLWQLGVELLVQLPSYPFPITPQLVGAVVQPLQPALHCPIVVCGPELVGYQLWTVRQSVEVLQPVETDVVPVAPGLTGRATSDQTPYE